MGKKPKKEKKPKVKKLSVFKWRGSLSATNTTLRSIIGLIVVMLGVTLTFIQASFIHIELAADVVVYLMPLLILTTLGSLLLGTLPGALIGLVIGGVLTLHAQYQPLDYYELLFVRFPFTIIFFILTGLFAGIFLARALRSDPPRTKRIVWVSIACLVISVLFSVAFSLHAFTTLVFRLAEVYTQLNNNDLRIEAMAMSTLEMLGDVGLQILIDAVLMSALCLLADYLSRRAQAMKGAMTIRTVFGSWLAVVVVLLYMLSIAVSVTIIFQSELSTAEENFRSEVGYLCKQIDKSSLYAEKFNRFVEEAKVKDNDIETAPYYDLKDYLSGAYLLDGYTLADDGTVIVLVNGIVYDSDDYRFPFFSEFETDFGSDMVGAVTRSLENDTLERFVYDAREQKILLSDNYSDLAGYSDDPEIYYVYADEVEVANDNHSLSTYTVIQMQPSSMVFSRRNAILGAISLSSLLLMAGIFAIVFFLLNRVVADGIDEENNALALICDGQLDTRATASGTQEFASLSDGINTTVDALKGWIAEAETRMDAELATAKAIQESALPGIFPPYPDIQKFDIYATMHAARQVGGDFYDFFLVGDDCGTSSGKLAFVVADVSGKGVPGALLMMKAKVQIRNYVGSGMELGEAMSEVNRQLVEGNEEGMFVTAWIGLLDYGTGHVEYVNAGHNPPLLWQRETGWQWMRKRSGPVLGFFDVPYKAHSVDCRPGDTFLLYTDGVTEAFDVNEELYGEPRLLEVANENFLLHPRELLEAVRDDVHRHALGAEQSDDITILTLEVGVPPETTATLVVEPEINELTRVNDFLHSELDRRLCPSRTQNQLDIAVEELFVNICNYAYADSEVPGHVRIQRTYSADPQSITVDFIDTGVPFDPLAKPDAVTPGRIEDVPIGGLGILMVKKCVDDISYEYSDGCNIVTIVKRW